MHKQDRRREWLVIVGIALLLHLVLFLFVKPEFFALFQKASTAGGGGDVPAVASMPDAIITLQIEIDDSDGDPVDPPREKPAHSDAPSEVPDKKDASDTRKSKVQNRPAEREGPGEALEALDIESLIGQDPLTIPYDGSGTGEVKIPPRPLEITWPDTDDLEECLGHEIDIQIQVDERGKALRVEAVDGDHPDDCVRAALESASRIVFEPGRVNGLPVKMWTQVRIDFRRKD